MQIDTVDIAAEIWRSLQEYVPARDREAAAEHFVLVLRGLDYTDEDLVQLSETDSYIAGVLAEEEFEEEQYAEEDSDEYDSE